MKVGDLIQRKAMWADPPISENHVGIILSKQIGGRNPSHPCATVFYPGTGKSYDIAEALIEVINESR